MRWDGTRRDRMGLDGTGRDETEHALIAAHLNYSSGLRFRVQLVSFDVG